MEETIIGKTTYGLEFCSAIAHNNLIATQFHLEKSGRVGLKMLANFLNWQVG
jgi:glutamine amidotransferase